MGAIFVITSEGCDSSIEAVFTSLEEAKEYIRIEDGYGTEVD